MKTIELAIALCAIETVIAAYPVSAQPVEWVRIDMYAGLGASEVASFRTPSAFAADDRVPADAMFLFQPSVMVSPVERCQVVVDLPMAAAVNPAAPQANLPYARWGVGDLRFSVASVVLSERRLIPSVQLVGTGSRQTATLPHLASPQTLGGQVVLYKSLHPRVRVAGVAGYSRYGTSKPATPFLPATRGFGGIAEFGVTTSSLLTLNVEQVVGASRDVGAAAAVESSDVQVTAMLTRYHEGRPRVALVVSAFGLRHENPFVVAGVRFAVASVRSHTR